MTSKVIIVPFSKQQPNLYRQLAVIDYLISPYKAILPSPNRLALDNVSTPIVIRPLKRRIFETVADILDKIYAGNTLTIS